MAQLRSTDIFGDLNVYNNLNIKNSLNIDEQITQPLIIGNLEGNANTQTKLNSQKTISISGDGTGSQSFDGSQGIDISLQISNDSHSHSNSTITSVDWSKLTNIPDPTITLSGDLSGSGTLTNLGSVTISQSVQDDSHNHDYQKYKLTNGELAKSASVDWNNYADTGFYMGYSLNNEIPGSSWRYSYVIKHNDSYSLQIMNDFGGSNMGFRTKYSGSWKPWKILWHSGNFDPNSKSNTGHTHQISNITNLQTTLDGKQQSSHTHSYLSNNADSEQTIGTKILNFNDGSKKINTDPRWNSDSTGTDTGNLHIWATKADGTNYGQSGIALYNGAETKYHYIYTISGGTTRLKNQNGYIDFGPMNTSHAHIYTDRADFYFNKDIKGSGKVYGAVYNDYAEYRNSSKMIDYGYVQIEDEKGNVIKCNEDRSKKVQGISSDTLGFGIGKQKDSDTPIAVAGRVLVYQENKDKLKVGDQVCSTKNGKVRKMKWWEKILFPEQVIGIISEFPNYKTWGTDNTKINGRIWIKI